MTGNFSTTLPNGSYRIVWNIIGQDGHPIEGDVAFGLSVEVEKKIELANTPMVSETASATEKKLVESKTEKNNDVRVTILLVLAAVLVVYGIYKLRVKKT
ncbi:copper resistance protein CopC [Planococcus donghaensis]|uniref:copper resistance protein CopC n=1 Tax=Planococcus donghaensis TaxID=414778 RepID=UPI001EE32F0B|nr:copper resistance protein CopC [Planococcus donghaensis]